MGFVMDGKRTSGVWMQVLAGALAVVSMVLGLGDLLLFRVFIRRLLLLTGTSPWAWRWWEMVGMILLALAWLAFVYLVAHFYQRAVERKRLGRLFAWVTLGQILPPLLALGLLQLVSYLTWRT